MIKKLLLFAIFIVGTLYVSADVIPFSGSTWTDLRNTISSANDGDTIVISNNVSDDGSGAIILDKNITIQGANPQPTLTMTGASRHFVVNDSTTIKNLVLSGSSNGGGIEVGNGSTLIADSCLFNNNTSGDFGGGIYGDSGSNIIISNSTFSNNEAVSQGGGVYAGGYFTSEANTFVNNNAGDGGAMFLADTVTISNNTFSNNTGVAVYVGNSAQTVIKFSTFNANEISAIYYENAGNQTLIGNIIYGNGTTEINVIPNFAIYNIVRAMDLGATNMNIPAGKVDSIFTVADNSTDVVTLADNGGFTQTFMIKEGGPAQNFVPDSVAGPVDTDQRGLPRNISGCPYYDAGSVDIQTIDVQVTYIINPIVVANGETLDISNEIVEQSGISRWLYYGTSTDRYNGTNSISSVITFPDTVYAQCISFSNCPTNADLYASATAYQQVTVTITYNNPGSYSTAIPTCVSAAQAEAWGGGGGGGGARSNVSCQANGGGGGGGAYALKNYTGGAVLSLSVANGGVRGENNERGYAGQSTTITSAGLTVTAGGGGGGTNHNCTAIGTSGDGMGGSGGIAIGGDINQNGGNGYNYNANPASSGGLSPNGGGITGQPANGNYAIPGNFPGGGGSGARVNAFFAQLEPGARGANGRVVVTFSFSLPVISGATNICDCGPSTLILSVSNPCSSASYTWRLNGNIVGTGTTLTTTAQAGTYTVEATISSYTYTGAATVATSGPGIMYSGGNFILTSAAHYVTTYPAPQETTWQDGGAASNWNDAANWSNGVPCPCTNVTIPTGTNSYPILQSATAAYPQPACDTIYFQFGSEVAKTNYLQYNAAKVDLTLQSNSWYTVAPVLQQQYSGDFFADETTFRKNPTYYMMYYQMQNPQNNQFNGSATWSAPFNTLDQLLPLCSGQAVWVDNGNQPNGNFTIHFPKDSTRYAYYNQFDQVSRYSGTIARGNQYRFIYEGNASYQTNGNGTFTQNFDNSNGFGQLIVGNPYMSHLDIVKFQDINSTYFASSFYIWKSGSPTEAYTYESYLIENGQVVVNTEGTPSSDFQVSPMQSVIMNVENSTISSLPIQFTPDMSITVPGATLQARAMSDNMIDDVIKLEILRSNVRQSGIAIRYRTGENKHFSSKKDVGTLISNSVVDYVSLYALADGKALSIYTLGDLDTPINLGISIGSRLKTEINSGKRETYSIRLPNGTFQSDEIEVYLYDMEKDSIHDLASSSYDFVYEIGADLVGRFQLYAEYVDPGDPTISNDNTITATEIVISKTDEKITVVSAKDDPVKNISVFSLTGIQLYEKTNLNVTNWSFPYPQRNQIVIVNVQTEKAFKTEKLSE